MQAYRIETQVQQNGIVTVQNVPVRAGESVEVIILVHPPANRMARYPLRGLPVRYAQPYEPIAEQDWDVA
jgi:hypothetical protein